MHLTTKALAVSYTHLDVYKRQVRGSALELKSMNPAELLITGQILSLDFS